jgi:hypothetical protein
MSGWKAKKKSINQRDKIIVFKCIAIMIEKQVKILKFMIAYS